MRRHVVVRHDRPPFSLRLETGTLLLLVGALGAVLLALAVGIVVGDYPLPPEEVVATLLGRGSSSSEFIVLTIRLPRLVTGALIGAALGMSGAIFQAVARNPLAAPDIIGITAGASVAAVLVVSAGGGAELIAPFALVGGLAAAAIVIGLSLGGGLSRMRLILVGIGVNAACLALVDFLLTRGRIEDVQRATVWLLGSLNGSSWDDVLLLGASLAVLALAAILLARHLEAVRLGDDVAVSLGSSVTWTRLALVLLGVVLAALAVTVAGPISFVAFISPHLARGLSRATGSGVLATSAVVGSVLVVAADLVARRAFAPAELPVGIFTAIVGAPYFLWLLVRAGRAGAAA